MKHLILVVSLFAMLYCFDSCRKDSTEEPFLTPSTIAGSWELETVSGDMPIKTFPAGNGNIYQFTETTYKKFTDGSLTKSGNYTLVPDNTAEATVGLALAPGQFTHRIIFDNDTAANKIFIDTQNGKLRVVSGFFPTDGGSISVYAKKAK